MRGVRMKKLIIVATLFVSVLALVALVVTKRQAKGPVVTQPTAAPELTQLSPPVFPSPVTTNQPTYVVPTIAISFPSSLPEFQTSASLIKDFVQTIAQKLGFAGAPEEIVGGQGTTYVWNAGTASLVASGNPVSVAYASGKAPSGPAATPAPSFDVAARNFLKSLGLPEAPYELIALPLRYFTTSGQDLVESASSSGATVLEAGYRYVLANRPVYGARPNEPGAAVRFSSNGDIFSLAAVLFPRATETGRLVAITTAEEASARLARGEGALLYLFSDGDKNNFTAPQYLVPSARVQSLSLGYYFSPGAASLSPVFLAEGAGQDGESGKEVKFMTLVSALLPSE